MRVVHISTNDSAGGAGRSALRLHQSLPQVGVASTMCVLNNSGRHAAVVPVRRDDRLLHRMLRVARGRVLAMVGRRARCGVRRDGSVFTLPWSQWGRDLLRTVPEADVVNLHWVTGLLDVGRGLPALARRRPLVWTLHDMNPFTGGCHYAGGCRGFEHRCGDCPLLGSSRGLDISRVIWRSKATALRRVGTRALRVVTPSRWLAEAARESSLFRALAIDVIPYGVDLGVFSPRSRESARAALGIPSTARVVMFAAHDLDDTRKGGAVLRQALEGALSHPAPWLLSAGRGRALPISNMKQRFVGAVEDDHLMALLYNAADLFVLPALEDNLPNTALEAVACGTPVLAFARGGVPEIVRPGETGVLVDEAEPSALRSALEHTLASTSHLDSMRRACREVAEAEYGVELQAERYRRVYESLVEAEGGS